MATEAARPTLARDVQRNPIAIKGIQERLSYHHKRPLRSGYRGTFKFKWSSRHE